MTSPQRLSVQEAADHFGVSASTIRRWIGADELRCEREDTPQGLRVWVVLEPEVEDVASESVAATSPALVTALEERIRSLESILATELQAGAELRALLTREQAAHDITRAELDDLKTMQRTLASQPTAVTVIEPPRRDDEPAALNALATLRGQYEQLQDRNARLQAEVYSLIEKVAAQPQPVEKPSLVARFFGAVGQESVTGFSV
jgi:uncharacterized coiled-coil protein SlyX